MHQKIICLFGPDGVGKSTHTKLIHDLLSVNKVKARTVWIRGPHTLSFLLSAILLRAGRVKETVNPFGRVKKTPHIGGGATVKHAWAFIEFVSVLPLVLVNVLIPLMVGYTIVADRYVLDTIVTIAYHIEDPEFIKGKMAKILLHLLPRGSILFHLDAGYDSLVERRGLLVEPKEFIEFQKQCYNWLGEKKSAHYIDTSHKSIKEVSEMMISIILPHQE